MGWNAVPESMAHAKGTARPWHGSSNVFDDPTNIEDAMSKAGIEPEWYEVVPLYMEHPLKHNATRAGSLHCVRRKTDLKVYGSCSKNWKPTQPIQAARFYQDWLRVGDVEMETIGSLREGETTWFLGKLKGESFALPDGDEIVSYVLVGVSAKPGVADVIKVTRVRVVCDNTWGLALGEDGAEFRHHHGTEFSEAEMEKAKRVLGLAPERILEDNLEILAMSERAVTRDEAIRVIADIFACEDPDLVPDAYRRGQLGYGWEKFREVANRATKKAVNAYYEAPGATPGNAWGIFNAVTYYADHIYGRNADNRLNSAWFGTTANLKKKAREKILSLST